MDLLLSPHTNPLSLSRPHSWDFYFINITVVIFEEQFFLLIVSIPKGVHLIYFTCKTGDVA